MRFVARLAMFAALVGCATAQSLVRQIPGVSPTSLDVGGDFDSDGYPDVIVGSELDSTAGLNAGAVRIVSGRFIVTGSGAAVLGVYASNVAGERMGTSVAWLTGGLCVAGAPNANSGKGRLYLLGPNSAATALVVHDTVDGAVTLGRLGEALAGLGDWDGDLVPEVAAGAPGLPTPTSPFGEVRTYRLQLIFFPTPSYALSGPHLTLSDGIQGSQFGAALCATDLGNLLGNGTRKELIVGARGSPDPAPPYATNCGTVRVYALAPGASTPSQVALVSGQHNQRLGETVHGGVDLDGDAIADLLAGSLGTPSAGFPGTIRAYSGAGLFTAQPLQLLHELSGDGFTNFGWRVIAVPDLNLDGHGELATGASGDGGGFGKAFVFSGETGQPILQYSGSAASAGVGKVLAYYPVGRILVNSGSSMLVLELYPVLPSVYCTAKLNSQGCLPAIAFNGSPSVLSPAPFDVRCTLVLNQKLGLLFYGFSAHDASFQGGTLCASLPIHRTSLQSSGGSVSGADCSGWFSLDFNARIQAGLDASLVIGQEVFAQYWSRDPASASTTSLSDALRFVINP